MCGIAGIVCLDGSCVRVEPACARMRDALAHRGPDDSGLFSWREGAMQVGLVHTRLSIIDLSPSGHQPMANEDGSIQLVFNGEIYNYRDLRPALLQRGHRLTSTSDSEVILHSYEDRREEALGDLRGMFAFALWDQKDRSLLLARDRLGIKPLYYQWDGSSLVFASEARAIVQSGLSSGQVDPEAVMLYLKAGFIPSPKTIYSGITSLNPGHWLRLKDGRVQVGEYWSLVDCLKTEPGLASRQEAVRTVREQLYGSVERHLIADVPVGVFLSGGVDSSSLVSLATRTGHTRIRTLTAVFDNDPLDESGYARRVAGRFGTEHTEVRVSSDQQDSLMHGFFQAMDQPTCDGFNTYLVSWAARQAGLKVCLSGLGADELFGGYPSFRRVPRLYHFLKHFGPVAAGIGRSGSLIPGDRCGRLADMCRSVSFENTYVGCRAIFPNRTISRLLDRPVDGYDFTQYLLAGTSAIRDLYRRVSSLELSAYMANQLLRDSDVFGMAHGLEIRVPFIDRMFLEHLARVPVGYLMDGRRHKQLLIDAVGDLPPEAYNRPKMGFTLPFQRWLNGQLKDEVTQEIRNSGVFHRPAAAKVLDEYYAGRLHWSRVWTLYVLSRCVGAGPTAPSASEGASPIWASCSGHVCTERQTVNEQQPAAKH